MAALQSLSFEDSFFPALAKTNVTLRAGSLDVAEGPFTFVAEQSGQFMPVVVTGVTKKPFGELPDEVFKRDGKGGRAETLRDMRIFEPSLTENSMVTVVSYQPLLTPQVF